ncbi:MAG: tetrameric acyl-CoA thioesterase [Lysobacterales bacterium CG17_big_fil_post_rev_8_21_14_2_50_64_11]|nr:MAG: tetrameric acyl-CoA thioesterase [Xanthomonadales bacterium CG17_big_fil_post_rev_8_21_14_2_50_64_11]PIX59395.1 MAG: tetrameric acyl-CoA thioesterase [Xanthomonadales bacterium CG_4_10_14_3_um_filter_64_11]
MKASRLRLLMNLWPPFACAGIRVERIAGDFSTVRVALHQHWYNRNYVGSHFGGSLFAMTDPFFMMLLLHQLGSDYIVWDKAAQIEFVKPGRGTVTADFHLDADTVAALRAAAARGEPVRHWFEVAVHNAEGEVVATVRKQLYIRNKRPLDGTRSGSLVG